MALITRCPDCATAFRVTPLQLQAHGGEVRCGRCAHVFNGFATLATMQGPEAVELSNDATPDRAESPRAPSPSVSDSIIAALADQEESRATGSETAQPEAASESPVQEAPEPGPPEPEPPAREEPTLQVPHAASAPGNGATEHYIGDDYADNYADDYGFDAPPSRKTSPIWGIASLFLLVVLAAQALYFFRAELSIIAPATRPFLEQYCELLGCTISLPSQRI
ncbi:DUF3426 domain-containing protein [Nitrosospira sp. NpAV]|uniref:DUF3426 domain-containing protein n=1 Tax=Nitrosospira sp. NpAV TaxID=58133 RepID=UPI0005A19F8B|nr:DUF3426 domain-containing protein [Nitrosospira sp. NpAV]KIO48762.1 hypothetical protein SQ11_09490 [Nitrosospira sp. NpAV]